MEDLAALAHDLPLLRRVPGFLHRAGERDHVAGDRAGPTPHPARADRARRASRNRSDCPAPFVHCSSSSCMPGLTGARHRLVGRHDHAAGCPRPGAAARARVSGTVVVQFGHDTMPRGMSRTSSGLTSATTSGTSGSMRNAADLSTTRAPARDGARRPLERERVVDVDDHEVEPVEATVGQHLAHDLAARERQARGPPSAATRTARSSPTGNGALLEQPQHLGADEPRRADDADVHHRGRSRRRLELERRRATRGPPARRRPRARRTRSGWSTWRSSRCSRSRRRASRTSAPRRRGWSSCPRRRATPGRSRRRSWRRRRRSRRPSCRRPRSCGRARPWAP